MRQRAMPKSTTACYRGVSYDLDLERCRRGLVWWQVERKLNSMASLAAAIGVSRSTVSRFFSGRATSLGVTVRILRELRLRFEEVARPVEREDSGAA